MVIDPVNETWESLNPNGFIKNVIIIPNPLKLPKYRLNGMRTKTKFLILNN